MTVRQYKTMPSGNNPGEGALTLGGVSDQFRQMKADIAQYLQSLGVVTATRSIQLGATEEYTVSTPILDLTQAQIRAGQNFFISFNQTNRISSVKIRLFGQAAVDLKRTKRADFIISGIRVDRVYHIAWDNSAYSVVNVFDPQDIGPRTLNWDRLDGDFPVDRIEDDSVPYSKMTGTIPADQIADGSIQNDKLDIADDSVSFSKLTGEILLTQVADEGIPTGKIADEAITTDKIADGAITVDKVAAGIITPSAAVSGMIVAFAGSNAPAGWLLCDGRRYARSLHSDLYDVLGTTWGGIQGSMFNVPDLRGRVLAGAGNNSGRLDRSAHGDYTGSKSHRLTAAQSGLPAHTHTIPRRASGQSENGTIETAGAHRFQTDANPNFELRTRSNAAQSASQSHPIVQPTALMNYIIKT